MKQKAKGFISLIAITIAYLIFRYPLFFLHGMKDFPHALYIVGFLIIVITGIVKNGSFIPIMTAIGYVIGFIAGELFQFDYGIGLNSMWIIWLCCFIAAALIGSVSSFLWERK